LCGYMPEHALVEPVEMDFKQKQEHELYLKQLIKKDGLNIKLYSIYRTL